MNIYSLINTLNFVGKTFSFDNTILFIEYKKY